MSSVDICVSRSRQWKLHDAPVAGRHIYQPRRCGSKLGLDHVPHAVTPLQRVHTLGHVKRTVAPAPAADSMPTLPPCASTSRLTRANPMPVPSTSSRGLSV